MSATADAAWAPRPVVLLAYHFPPSREVGALRAWKVAAALRDAGHAISVVRRAAPDDPEDERRDGMRVISVIPALSPREGYAALRARLARRNGGNGPGAASEASAWRPPERVSDLKRFLLSLFWLPDDSQGFIARAAKAAARALEPGSILYSTSPPHSAQVAALLAHLSTRAPWVVELRDPWTDNPGKPWYCRTALTDGIERWLERQCLARASLVVAVSEGIGRLVGGHAGVNPPLLVRNGIDAIAPDTPLARAAGPVRVLHLGTCYLGRDPRPLLRSVAALRARGALPADGVVIELVGQCEWFDGIAMREVASQLGIDDLVRFVPWLPHDEARQRMETADVLLLLAEGQPNQVPNKLYEYLGARRPMLVFAEPDGETGRMVRSAGGHVLTHAKDPELESAVARALRPAAAAVGDPAVLAEWSTERQMAALVYAVGGLGPQARAARPSS